MKEPVVELGQTQQSVSDLFFYLYRRALHPELEILVAPTRQVFADRIQTAVTAAEIDCLIGNGLALDFTDVEVMNFGFPSEHAHALYDRPYLGFQGFLDRHHQADS